MKKTVIVTGARRGLGLAIVKKLVDEGYKVLAVARAESSELINICDDENVFFEKFDLANVDDIGTWVNKLTKRQGRIYALVNNAAIGGDGILATMHEDDISYTIKVNLHSPIILTKYVCRSMLIAGKGRIINISSIIATTGFSGLAVYAATKSGLIGFTKSLSRELGKVGINVNCIAPGYMETDMTKSLDQVKLSTIKRRSPSGKLATVESVANSVSFLLGETGSLISGTTLTVDAGSTA